MNLRDFNFKRQPVAVAAALLAAVITIAPAANAQEGATNDGSSEATAAAEQFASPGMQIPLDGTSVETFENSLETIRGETTEAEFKTIQNALDYLLVYDLGARRDRELLYKRLDGKTPAEILEMVRWRLEGRNPGPR